MKSLRYAFGMLFTATAALSMNASEVQNFLFDFGPNNVANRGETTPADVADANGNYWNNIHSTSGNFINAGSVFENIKNTSGLNIPGMAVTVVGQFNTNGMSGGGGLLTPDATLLGDLAVATATEDYMFLDGNNVDNRAFTISGLDPEHAYSFAIFTSRKATDNRTGRFTIEGFNSFSGENQAAGSGIGANGENQNTSVVLQSEPVFPTAEGVIKITVSRVSGAYIPINCMMMTEADGVNRPVIDTYDRKFYFDFGATDKASNKCEITVSPDANGNHWNNITNTADDSKYAAAGTVFDNIADAGANESTLTVTLNDRFSTNGMSGGGGLLSPDATLLGDLAISTATCDYFFYEADQSDCSMTFGGLDPEKAYRFHMFASRSAGDNRTGNYRLAGYNLWEGLMQAAGSNIGGSGINQNNSTILVSDYIFADADGNIKLTIMRQSGTYIPLNCMKIEEFSGIERPVINNFSSMTLDGVSTEGRRVIVSRKSIDGVETNAYSVVADLASGEFMISAIDEKGAVHKFGRGDSDSKLKENGEAFVSNGLPTLIEIDFDTKTINITEIDNIRLIGSAVGSWSLNDFKQMNYDGDLVYSWTGRLEGHDSSTDSGRIGLYINGSWTAFKRSHIDSDYNAVLSLGNGADIPINPGSYSMSFNLADGVLKVENGENELDNMRITVFGSSVANGQGAEQIDNENHGYIWHYGQLLQERNKDSQSGNPFYISNISIGGNSTVNLLNRYDDMRREFGKYVVFGVSLGNEGLHESADKEATYNQFKTNMLKLIDMVRADGKVPVICNNYTRGDFSDDDYKYILEMDREIGLWNLPSVNLLGAIDSKSGRWADGYQNGTDIYHPNQAGHDEFAYAMVPSLFDALESGKQLCADRLPAEGTDMAHQSLSATPEGTMHSFAFVLNTKATESDYNIGQINMADGRTLTISHSNGKFIASVGENEISVASDGEDALIALSYTYASATLDLEVYNGDKLAGRDRDKVMSLVPSEFTVGKSDFTLSEAMLYRSALSQADVESLAKGELQKGSMELYSVFNNPESEAAAEAVVAAVENHAMSTNTFTLSSDITDSACEIESADTEADTRYYSIEGIEILNPVKGGFYIAVGNGSSRKIVF